MQSTKNQINNKKHRNGVDYMCVVKPNNQPNLTKKAKGA